MESITILYVSLSMFDKHGYMILADQVKFKANG